MNRIEIGRELKHHCQSCVSSTRTHRIKHSGQLLASVNRTVTRCGIKKVSQGFLDIFPQQLIISKYKYIHAYLRSYLCRIQYFLTKFCRIKRDHLVILHFIIQTQKNRHFVLNWYDVSPQNLARRCRTQCQVHGSLKIIFLNSRQIDRQTYLYSAKYSKQSLRWRTADMLGRPVLHHCNFLIFKTAAVHHLRISN